MFKQFFLQTVTEKIGTLDTSIPFHSFQKCIKSGIIMHGYPLHKTEPASWFNCP